MTSFLSRMANEASAALSDAYGHVVHGDDAGSSAKVVWVVHPTKVPIDINNLGSEGVGEVGADNKNKGGGGENANSPGRQSSYLFTQKFGEWKWKIVLAISILLCDGTFIEDIMDEKLFSYMTYTDKFHFSNSWFSSK